MNKTSWFFFFASFWSKIFLAETFFALIVEFERMPCNQLTTPQKRVLERLPLSAPSRCLFVCLSAFNSRWSIDCNAYATFEREHNVLRLIISTVCTVCVFDAKNSSSRFFQVQNRNCNLQTVDLSLSRSLLNARTAFMWINRSNYRNGISE